jgi:hypothetical protein
MGSTLSILQKDSKVTFFLHEQFAHKSVDEMLFEPSYRKQHKQSPFDQKQNGIKTYVLRELDND